MTPRRARRTLPVAVHCHASSLDAPVEPELDSRDGAG
jgi:hypothetical protein